MPDIRVDPPALRQTAAKIRQAADRVLALAEEGEETAASAPSYDGQFGPQVQSMGLEAHAQMTAVATKLTALSDALLIKAEEFEAADHETEGGLAGLIAQFRAWIASLGRPQGSPWLFLSPAFEWLFQDGGPDDNGQSPQPWYATLAIELSKAWDWYHRSINLPLYDELAAWQGIDDNGRKIALYHLGQIWFAYDKVVNQPIYEGVETWKGNLDNARTIVMYGLARLWFGYDKAVNQPIYKGVEALPEDLGNLFVVQTPLSGPGGPISDWLTTLAAADTSGNPISQVGTELANLIGDRTTTVTFLDLPAGVVPWRGYVLLPEYMAGMPGTSLGAGNLGFLSHEFTHVLERELPGEAYWPDGGLSLVGVRPIGDSTNYMEVLSEIVGLTIEYDHRITANPADPLLPGIRDQLATYTGSDAPNAVRVLVHDSWNSNDEAANGVYRNNYVHELSVDDHRIPQESWDHWLREMGFSDASIKHIEDLASHGAAKYIDESLVDPQTGVPVTTASTPTGTTQTGSLPSITPTPVPSPTPTPTSTPSPTQTPTSSATPSPTSTPSPTATATPPPATPGSTRSTPR